MDKRVEMLLNNHQRVADDFVDFVERLKTIPECSSILKLLTCDQMIVYKLFKVCATNLSNMYELMNGLKHAFTDDGEYQIVREIDTSLTDHRERFNAHFIQEGKEPLYKETTCYNYCIISFGDCSRKSINNEELGDIIDAFQKGYDFYAANEAEIESTPRRRLNPVYAEWRALKEAAEDLLKKLYEESK